MNDTTPNIAVIVRERVLSRSGVERVAMSSRMFDVARTIALASFPPRLSKIETKRRLCERLYGDEVNVDDYIEHVTNQKLTETSITSCYCVLGFRQTSTMWAGRD